MMRSSERIAGRLLPLSLVLACQEPTTPTRIPATQGALAALVTDNVVATLALVPDSQMVFVGDRFKITARPKNAAGQLLDRSVRWTVGTPTVAKALDSLKATMTFKALRVGSTSIKATVDAKSRSAKVVVRSVTGAKVIVTPATATVASGGTVRFVATGLTLSGERAEVNVTWTATGGRISATGVLTAGTTPGTYRVIATSRFGAADTSTVTITATANAVASVILVPEAASLVAGQSIEFLAYGRTSAGDSVSVPVTYTATGGTITSTGRYTAGSAAGTYRVIARNAAGVADSAPVVITAAAIARVTLLPDIAASRAGATTRFVAWAWNTLGDSVPQSMRYESTCGTVTDAGVYTAPGVDAGSCLVTASVNGKADTTELVLLPNTRNNGVPYGLFNVWTSATTTQSTGVPAFTASHDYVSAGNLLSQISAARAQGVRLVLAMTGGSHDRYKTDGVFDPAKWKAAVDAYDTPAIRDAVAQGVADGTVIGNSVMDEPQQSGQSDSPTKSWGPPGTMTKARVDGLCAYVKAIFPTLPAGVGHDYAVFEPDSSYRVCDFLMSQYAWRKGNVFAYRDGALALAARDGIAIVFSLNILDGGIRDTKTGLCPIPETGGYGTQSPNCRMTAAQVRDWGKVLGQAGCALLSWRYDGAFMANPQNQAAISDVAITLSRLPQRRCAGDRAPNAPPVAIFASSCNDLTCSFTDQSRDEDGTIADWSWDFGDGISSTSRHPTHTYIAEGAYPVALAVRDDKGAPGNVTQTVTVVAPPPANLAPTATYTASCQDLNCSFSDESTDDGTVTAWSWSFGDGGSSTERHPSHSYDVAGFYRVTLVVTDDREATGTITQDVVAGAPPAGP